MITDKSPSPNTLEMRRIAKALLRNPYRCFVPDRTLKRVLAQRCALATNWGSYNTRAGRVYTFADAQARDQFAKASGATEVEDGKADQ